MAVDVGRSNPLRRQRPQQHDDADNDDGANATAGDEYVEIMKRTLKMKKMVVVAAVFSTFSISLIMK